MHWTNNAQGGPLDQQQQQRQQLGYPPRKESNYLTAIGAGLNYSTPNSDEAFGELDSMTGLSAANNLTVSAMSAGDNTSNPVLLVDPSYCSESGDIHFDHPLPNRYPASIASYSSDESTGAFSYSNSDLSSGDFSLGRSFDDPLSYSPSTTARSSPYAPSDGFSDFFDQGRGRAHTIPTRTLSVAMSPFHDTSDSPEFGCSPPTAQHVGLQSTHSSWEGSIPNTPQMKSSFRALQPHTSDNEYTRTSESTNTSSCGGHLHVPMRSSPRRGSDPPSFAAGQAPQTAMDWSPERQVGSLHHRNSHGHPALEGVVARHGSQGQRSHVHNALHPHFVHGQLTAPPTPMPPARRKGVRKQKLSQETKERARKTRNEKTMCLSCRLSKVKCVGEAGQECARCSNKNIDKGPRVCSRAYFFHYVKIESTNFMLYHHVYPRHADNRRRVATAPLPTAFNLAEFLTKIRGISNLNNLAIHQSGTFFASFDLVVFEQYVSNLVEPAPQSTTFAEFINDKMPQFERNKNWQKCVQHQAPLDGSLETWLNWAALPTHFDYALVSKLDHQARRLDPSDTQDLELIKLSAQIVSIVTRALELMTYAKLEAQLKKDEMVGPDFLQSLGRLLLHLRWNMAWWKRLGFTAPVLDANDAAYVRRDQTVRKVRHLCRALYMYFCFYRRARLQQEHLFGYDLGGLRSVYPYATKPVLERFPAIESAEGFEAWMKEGDHSLMECGSLQDLIISSHD